MAETSAFRRFEEFCVRKTREATAADIHPLRSVEDRLSQFPTLRVGNDWSRSFYDGEFALFAPPASVPAVTLVFVRSRDHNTGADNPDELGGGPTDKHLIYEGLSRVGADAVLAGAKTASGTNTFFSLWRPELISLRQSLGLPRHPAQIVVSATGWIDVERTLLFNVPHVPVFVLAGAECQARCRTDFDRRPWITVIAAESADLHGALRQLRVQHGIRRISAVGGRHTATTLIDAGLVQDLCLTTTQRTAGQPDTPFYAGRRNLSFEVVSRKTLADGPYPITVDHLLLT